MTIPHHQGTPPYRPPHVPFWQSEEWAPDDWLMHEWRKEVAHAKWMLGDPGSLAGTERPGVVSPLGALSCHGRLVSGTPINMLPVERDETVGIDRTTPTPP